METMEHEIKVAQMEAAARSTKGLPVGQRVRAVGFAVVTEDQLKERFACKAIEDAQNAAIKAKLIADFCAEKGKPWNALEVEGWDCNDSGSRFTIGFTAPEERAKKAEQKKKGFGTIGFFDLQSAFMSSMLRGRLGDTKSAQKKSCTVRLEKLDEYMEEIPSRVMDSLKVAKMCGLAKFAVAYPVLEDAPQPDPILVAYLGEKMIEIDMWE